MKTRHMSAGLLVAALAPGLNACAGAPFARDFPLADCAFVTESQNLYFPLQIGSTSHLDNAACVAAGNCDTLEKVIITVLNETHDITMAIDGVMRTIPTRVVEERETKNGELVEVSRNYFAQCSGTQDVYYFGEAVDIYENGQIVDNHGAWEAGVDGARPGLVMPGGAFRPGARYYQEFAQDVAMDRAENVRAGLTVEVPAGTFSDCVKIEETTPLEPGHVSAKFYCPGVGIARDADAVLTQIVE